MEVREVDRDSQQLQDRTLSLAVRIVKFCQFLDEKGRTARVLSKPLLRSGTTIGACVREARAANRERDCLNQLGIALKEARATEYWLLVLGESELVKEKKVKALREESKEIIERLVAITQRLREKQRSVTTNVQLRTAEVGND